MVQLWSGMRDNLPKLTKNAFAIFQPLSDTIFIINAERVLPIKINCSTSKGAFMETTTDYPSCIGIRRIQKYPNSKWLKIFSDSHFRFPWNQLWLNQIRQQILFCGSISIWSINTLIICNRIMGGRQCQTQLVLFFVQHKLSFCHHTNRIDYIQKVSNQLFLYIPCQLCTESLDRNSEMSNMPKDQALKLFSRMQPLFLY